MKKVPALLTPPPMATENGSPKEAVGGDRPVKGQVLLRQSESQIRSSDAVTSGIFVCPADGTYASFAPLSCPPKPQQQQQQQAAESGNAVPRDEKFITQVVSGSGLSPAAAVTHNAAIWVSPADGTFQSFRPSSQL